MSQSAGNVLAGCAGRRSWSVCLPRVNKRGAILPESMKCTVLLLQRLRGIEYMPVRANGKRTIPCSSNTPMVANKMKVATAFSDCKIAKKKMIGGYRNNRLVTTTILSILLTAQRAFSSDRGEFTSLRRNDDFPSQPGSSFFRTMPSAYRAIIRFT